MSDLPINYTFVKRKKLDLTEDNGEVKSYVVLVLDDEENTKYFTKISSLKKTLEKVEDTTDVSHWLITQSFIDLAVSDLMREEFTINMKEARHIDNIVPTLLNFPIEHFEGDTNECFLCLNNGTKIKNTDY